MTLRRGLAVGLSIALIVLALFAALRADTPPLQDTRGQPLPNAIAELRGLQLGGLDQWVLLRGHDRRNPVLLWLHGGPGGAQMPFAHRLDTELERHFVVVHWDQRGAGKSNHGDFDPATMQLEQYLADAGELIQWLRQHLDQDRIVLLGHSWGTRLGMQLIHEHPNWFHAYVGVSQVVDHGDATRLAWQWLARRIDPADAPHDWHTLQSIPIPALRHQDYRQLMRLVDSYGGSLDAGLGTLARTALISPEYNLVDLWRLWRGMQRGGGPMHADGQMQDYDLRQQITEVAVPVHFFMGARDHNTPLVLARDYLQQLTAPARELVVFENSAHTPFLA